MIHFREELDELQRQLLEMAGLVESAIHQSIDALVRRDEQDAKEVLWKEALINQKDLEIDEFATRLLALYQPMARDMRFLTAVIKMNGDLERMGDLAVNITQRALALMHDAPVKPLVDSEAISCRVHAETLTRHGYPITFDQVLQRFLGVSDHEAGLIIEAEMGRRLPDDFETQRKQAVLQCYAGELRAIPHIGETIAALCEALASAKRQ